MRITSQTFYRDTLASIENQRSDINNLTQQLASGKKVSQPSDNPVAFASSQRLQAHLQSLNQYSADNSSLSNQLNLASSTLSETLTSINQVRSIALQANNGTTSSGNRSALIKQVASIKQQLLGLANTQGESGGYLFAGTNSANRPFETSAGGKVQYHGDGGGSTTQISSNRKVSSLLSGKAFASVPQGNGYGKVSVAAANTGSGTVTLSGITNQSTAASFRRSANPYNIKIESSSSSESGLKYEVTQNGSAVSSGAFSQGQTLQLGGMSVEFKGDAGVGDTFSLSPSRQQSVFDTIDNLTSALTQSLGSGAQKAQSTQKINSVLSNLKQASTHILSQQSTVGVSLSAIQDANNTNSAQTLNDKSALSSKTAANIPKVITALDEHQASLTAAMKAFGSVSQLSLFKYL